MFCFAAPGRVCGRDYVLYHSSLNGSVKADVLFCRLYAGMQLGICFVPPFSKWKYKRQMSCFAAYMQVYSREYVSYHPSLNGNLNGGQACKLPSRCLRRPTPLAPISTLTTEPMLVRNPCPTTPTGLSVRAFTEPHQVNFTIVCKTTFTT